MKGQRELGKAAILVLVVGLPWLVPLVRGSDLLRLGLDLKGGIHLALKVEAADAVKAVLDNRLSALKAAIQKRGLHSRNAVVDEAAPGLVVVGYDAVARDEYQRIIDAELPGYEVRIEGSDLRVTMPSLEVDRIKEDAIQDTVERIRVRVDAFGVAEAAVQRQGMQSDRILIQIPGVDDPERVKDLVAKPAFLEFKKVVGPPGFEGARFTGAESRERLLEVFGGQLPADVDAFETDPNASGGRVVWYPLSAASPVSGNDLINARTGRGELGSAEVQFTLTPEAGVRFESFTSESIGQPLAALLDKRVIQVATIQNTIRENGRITGLTTLQEADDLALKLRSGALPARTTVLEERTVGPSLGADSIRQGVRAALAGLIISIGFMLVYYKGSGINAVVALLLNVALIFSVMASLQATLTLPGIAGLILTFGMALDANVLIFERIREEMRTGKTVKASIDAGFKKAFTTIFDSNLTTVLAALLLFQFGTGPVKGFALTLIIGLGASMYTAIVVSRGIFDALTSRKTRVERLSI